LHRLRKPNRKARDFSLIAGRAHMIKVETQQPDDGSRARLLETARAMVLRGDKKFSIASLCAEAGLDRAAFRACFTGKTALMAALMQPVAQATLEPPAGDAWLERRLRVFERALNALEAKADNNARHHALAIARLEERLSGETKPAVPASKPRSEPQMPVVVATPEPQVKIKAEIKRSPLLLPVTPPPESTPSKSEMAELLQGARVAAREAVIVEDAPQPRSSARLRWLAIGALSLVALFICIGLTLGDTARGLQGDGGSGVSHRHVAASGLARTIALADADDARAQTFLALTYLRGGDATAAARWGRQAALRGDPVAEYLLGTLYHHGDGVAPDAVKAFGYFAAAASQGNVKAMHNLAIAYAEGLGTGRDAARAADWFARAAARGYVDSAFDLAVLYERGDGVAQDTAAALKWYGVAERAGDAPAAARAEFLRRQLGVAGTRDAAQDFVPLAVDIAANDVPRL
jgi:TPR repeat protein